MRAYKKLLAAAVIAGSISLSGVSTATRAEAVVPIDGSPGCYWYSWYDYGSLFEGLAGYCLTGRPGEGVLFFDFEGNYW